MDVEEVQVEGELKVWLFMLFSPYFLYVTFQQQKFFNKFNDGVHDKFLSLFFATGFFGTCDVR